MHILGNLTKLFRAGSVSDLEKMINEFARTHKVVDVKITPYQVDMRGTGLRVSDFVASFLATVMHEVDLTQMDMDDEINDYVDETVKEMIHAEDMKREIERQTYSFAPPPPRMDERITKAREKVLASDEYQAFVDSVKEKYGDL